MAVITGQHASAEALESLLRGSPFAVVPAAPTAASPGRGLVAGPAPDPAPGPALGPAHRARELLNQVALLTRCLQLPDVTEVEWRQWPAAIAEANRRLDVLYAGGLSRSFRGESTASHRHPEAGAA